MVNNNPVATSGSQNTRHHRVVSDNIYFAQLNLQHGKASTAVLCKHIGDLDSTAVLIQEPWINKGNILGLNSSDIILHRGSNGESARSCTKGLEAYALPQFGNRDITTVCVTYKVNDCINRLVLSSVYMPIEETLPSVLVEQLYRYCKDKHLSLILACDTNAHHPLWGSDDVNHRGQSLCEFVATTNLEVANTGGEPTFCAGNSWSVIDVTFVSRELLDDMHNWQVSKTDTMSDHRMITFS